jgi:hypothetical protein
MKTMIKKVLNKALLKHLFRSDNFNDRSSFTKRSNI